MYYLDIKDDTQTTQRRDQIGLATGKLCQYLKPSHISRHPIIETIISNKRIDELIFCQAMPTMSQLYENLVGPQINLSSKSFFSIEEKDAAILVCLQEMPSKCRHLRKHLRSKAGFQWSRYLCTTTTTTNLAMRGTSPQQLPRTAPDVHSTSFPSPECYGL